MELQGSDNVFNSFYSDRKRPPVIHEKSAQKNKPKRLTTKKASHFIKAGLIDQV
jgi:hypothetical protein